MKTSHQGWVLTQATFLMLIAIVNTKFHTLQCNAIDPEYGVFKKCEIKLISRTRNVININYEQKMKVDNLVIRLQFLKKANGWRPFFYDIKINACDYLAKPNNWVPIVKLAYTYLKQFTNFNQTCPFMPGTEFHVNNLSYDLEQFLKIFPIDVGEYGLHTNWYNNNKLRLTINGSYIYSDYRQQQ